MNVYLRYLASLALVATTFCPLAYGAEHTIQNRIACTSEQEVMEFFALAKHGEAQGWNIEMVMHYAPHQGVECHVVSGTVTYVGPVLQFVWTHQQGDLAVHVHEVTSPTGVPIYVWNTIPVGDPV